MSTKAVLAPAEWMPREAAAKLLGVKIRQLERRAHDGYIEKMTGQRKPTERNPPVFYSRADILALKAGTPNMHARPETEARPEPEKLQQSAATSQALALVPRKEGRWVTLPNRAPEDTAMLADFMASLLATKADPKPWLTLDEAAEYSGFTRAYLLQLADTAKAHVVRDMGRGSRGGRFRFNRSELAK